MSSSVSAPAYDVELTWTALPGAVRYSVYLRYGDTPFGAPLRVGLGESVSAGVVRTVVRNVELGATARFAVSSTDSSGTETPRSNELSITYRQAARVIDSDGDGLTDAEEDTDLDQTVDAGETDPRNPDSDGDGWRDGDEVTAGSNPLDPADSPLQACGNGRLEPGELCDDGNARNGDGCLNNCVPATCGDGFVYRGVEECDDGALNSDADPTACREDCTRHDLCGDADRDGLVTEADALLIAQAAIGSNASCRFSACDTNGDGSLTTTDAARVLMVLSTPESSTLDCNMTVTVSLLSGSNLDLLFLLVDYSRTGSTFVGEDQSVQCRLIAADPQRTGFGNNVSKQRLWVNMLFSEPIAGPVDLLECDFVNRALSGSVLFASDFGVSVTAYQGAGQDRPEVGLRF